MIQDSHWTPLSSILTTLCSMCGILCSCPLLPSRRLSPSSFFSCVVVRWGSVVFFPFVHFPLPSLGREKSGAQLVVRVFSGAPPSVVDVKCLARKIFAKVTKAWRILAPQASLFSVSLPLSPPQGVGLLSEFVFVCFVTFLGESDVRWLCLVGIVYLRAVVSRRNHGPDLWKFDTLW